MPQPYRLIVGDLRNVDGTDYTTVRTTAIQFADGTIDDGSVHEPRTSTWAIPGIRVSKHEGSAPYSLMPLTRPIGGHSDEQRGQTRWRGIDVRLGRCRYTR